MKSIFLKAKEWIIEKQNDIILFISVFLISLFSFALGYIIAKTEEKKPLIFEEALDYYETEKDSDNWSRG